MKKISELPRHETEIYVVGSGASLNYISKDFFKDKIIVGINLIHRIIPVTYAFAHHHQGIPEMLGKGLTTITSEYDMGLYNKKKIDKRLKTDPNLYVYHHPHNLLYDYSENHRDYDYIDLSGFDDKDMLVTGTTTVSAIHLAYRLGAAFIILVGIDGGFLDEKLNVDGYYSTEQGWTEWEHIRASQPQIDLICNKIRERGIGVYSLNPFNNFALEGHTFTIPPNENCLLDS